MFELLLHLAEISLAVTTPWLALEDHASRRIAKQEKRAKQPAFPIEHEDITY